LEFRLKISSGEMQWLRGNSILIEDEYSNPTDEEVLAEAFSFQIEKDGRYGSSFTLETLELKKV